MTKKAAAAPAERPAKAPASRIAVLVWRGGYDDVTRLNFADPLDALLTAIGYLRQKYNVRLTDAACEALEALSPELERLLPAHGGAPGAARAELAKPVPDLGAVPVGKRLRAHGAPPRAVFAAPGAAPAALD